MPFTRIPPRRLRRIFVPTLIVYLAIGWPPFLLVGEPPKMIRLQLAGSEAQAREIVAGWSEAETVDMAYLQGVDSLHVVAYAILLAVGVVWAGRQLRGRPARWAPAMAWLPVAAGVFDALENVGMIVMIRGHVDAPVPTITTTFAVAKYSMLLVVLPYLVAGLVARMRAPGGREPRPSAAA